MLCNSYISGYTLPHEHDSLILPQNKSALAGILDVLVSDELTAPYDSIKLEELTSDVDANDLGRIPLNECGVATVGRLLKIIGLFCRISSLL